MYEVGVIQQRGISMRVLCYMIESAHIDQPLSSIIVHSTGAYDVRGVFVTTQEYP